MQVRVTWRVVALALLVGGCATVPPGRQVGGSPADPEVLQEWTARGRLALSARGEGGSGSFVWQQRSAETDLAVRGPLGAGGMRVLTDGDVLLLTDAGGRMLDGPAARDELERRLGVPLPLAELRYWMLGVPAPGPLDDGGAGEGPGFAQNGWQVRLEASRTVGPWRLPARLTATAGELRVRILVDEWQLAPPP